MQSDADKILDNEQIEAWGAYFESTHELEGPRYAEIEPWAWARLQQRLRAINARRRKLVAA